MRRLIAVIEVRRRTRAAVTEEVTTDEVVEVRRVEGDQLVLAEANAAPRVLVVRTVTAEGCILDQHELAIGERMLIAPWELRLVAVRSVDARTMPGGSELERDLLAGIAVAPDDDEPRQIYADWLLSQPAQSDRDRGELVQVQCALVASPSIEHRRALRTRESELLAGLPVPSFGDVRVELVWHRGFLERCRGELGEFARHAFALFEVAPMLVSVDLEVAAMPNQSLLWRLATVEPLGQIRELAIAPAAGASLAGTLGDTILIALAPRLASLRRLRVSSMQVGQGGVAAILDGPGAPQLAMLDLGDNPLPGAAMQALAGSQRIQPAVLRLARCHFTHRDVEVLAAAPWLVEVEELDLGDNAVQNTGAAALASVAFRRLRRLALASCGIKEARALLRSPHLARLTHLRMHRNAIGDAAAIALSKSRARSIVELDLQSCNIGDAGVTALAESPGSRAARRWRLGGNPISDVGARAILDSIHLRDLAELELVGCDLSEPVRDELRERFATFVV